MRNALDQPQNIVLLGGTSDIGLAIVRALAGPVTQRVVLACRDTAAGEKAAAELDLPGVEVVEFDADASSTHTTFVEHLVARVGDLDVVILAFGVLGDQAAFDADPAAAAAAVTTNYVGAVSIGLAIAAQLRAQGHGKMVVLSSVAGERVRRANFVYGSSKAGLDGFAQGLGDSLTGSGAGVLVVRPGFVTTSMTDGLTPAPFATTAEKVADATVHALRSGRRTVWVPGVLRVVFSVFRHLPGPVWRRLPLG
ncbi:MAG TPA: decaprenylphospho-beta-D-erythro-pentofuranosid-2-ulose 2-reductase [Ilumatobacteraceae bacterium]